MKFISVFLFFIPSLWAISLNWEQYKRETILELPKIAGWCTAEKAEKLMDFIYEFQPGLCVEIGVFGGSTTYPIARALHFLHSGKAMAIDAWDAQIAIEGLELDDPNLVWWSGLDMGEIYKQFIFLLKSKKLLKYCQPIVKRSCEACSLFEDDSIDFLYIDGNFSSEGSLQDVLNYFQKVKKGGYIWFNDADSLQKNKAVSFLMKNCTWLKQRSLGKKCIVFKK